MTVYSEDKSVEIVLEFWEDGRGKALSSWEAGGGRKEGTWDENMYQEKKN